MTDRVSVIRERLTAALAPLHLEVFDDSALHAGHAGAAGGAGHYRVRILSEKFRGLPMLARHRLVYEALRPLIPEQIHALGIEADAPGERARKPDSIDT
ncbi:MAG: BolA family transcriptional regulator [Steroidobacteraceae bacterium]|nr:BolA family transcriptional regulator [Steroidobacteraceae bacterium]